MPKKPTKSKEEKSAEGYFPVEESSIKYSTEKKVKEFVPESPKTFTEKKYKSIDRKSLEVIEKLGNKKTKKTKKKTSKKNTKSKTQKNTKKYEIPKVKLKTSGYELIITEKPQAALKIANALSSDSKAVQKSINKVPYYEITRNNRKIVVACAVGHLFTLKQNSSGTKVPTFDISWVPNYLARKNDFTKRYYDTILKLVKDANSLTVATDYDIEGEVIGLNVLRYICNQQDASRMKFSTLTPKELGDAYENKYPTLDWGQAIAGETRHFLDWFYGINLSRALMNSIKTTGKFKIMSIGRVQGPALNLIVKKEKEINLFKSKPYWQVSIKIPDRISSAGIWLKHNKDLFDKKELDKFENLEGKTALVETKKRQESLPPKPPFNLTSLQTEAYKLYGTKPSRTLQIAQSLYLAGLISYPRTSSQKLPAEIGYKEILKKIAKKYKAEKLLLRNKPVEGKKSDPAHPSIYPTGTEGPILSGEDKKIYELIVKRFLCLFCEDALIDHKTISATIDNLKFSTKGKTIAKKAWLEIYPSKPKEEKIPDIEGEVKIIESKTEEKETQPPKRFSPASIVSELEKIDLGTKATRSSILETLYDRGYIEGQQSISATSLGISLIEALEKYSPIIIDENLTREFEKGMEKIQDLENKEDQIKIENKIINGAKESITNISKDFEKHEKKIGSELVDANTQFREKQKIENRIIECPKCNQGHLAITYSKKTRRYFVACDAYPNCQNTFSLPPNGVIKKTEKTCEECNWPMLMRLAKGRKPWIFCFNPKCPTNEKWVKRREENK